MPLKAAERADLRFMRLALRLARRGYGTTSPNPMVGAILVKGGRVIGRGWHQRAGGPHAEIEALQDAAGRGYSARDATLYVTLEPCCTWGRTPPCTKAIQAAGIKRVVVGATDPNPQHRGRAFRLLRRAGIEVTAGIAEADCERLNEAFNHWIVTRTPWVVVKAAMTLDGKIATAMGESKWITGPESRAGGMHLREGADAILVGIRTVLADDPSLTYRRPLEKVGPAMKKKKPAAPVADGAVYRLRRVVLDSLARTPLTARVVNDEHKHLTTIVVSRAAPRSRVAALARRVRVLMAPTARRREGLRSAGIDLRWLLQRLGKEGVTQLLVEGGGEVNASFLFGGFAHRVSFFYAPKILGGRNSRAGVGGLGAVSLADSLRLRELEWVQLGPDLALTARVERVGI